VTSQEDMKLVGSFRLNSYALKKSYMLNSLGADGLDELDDKSMVFAAWANNQIIATVRLCAYPFETSEFVEKKTLYEFLGDNYVDNYLEWSRLLVNPAIKNPRILPSLILYAGTHILETTNYSHYFGYSTPIVRKLFSRFGIASIALNFKIPSRGEHQYYLLKGNFLNSFLHVKKKTPSHA